MPPPPPPPAAAPAPVQAEGRFRGEAAKEAPVEPMWAAVREFPVPTYPADYEGPRTDFRETVFFAPSVVTDDRGEARVSFPLSDSVTTFRATAEGLSLAGRVGRGQGVIASRLPVSIAAKLPLELGVGDVVDLPVSITNATSRAQTTRLEATFGAALRRTAGDARATLTLKPGETTTLYYGLKVEGDVRAAGAGDLAFGAEAASLRDALARKVRLVPEGQPQEIARAGKLDGSTVITETFDLPEAVPGTLEASLSVFPSPAVALVAGTEAMLAEPSGCFEQASSTNYPNVMVVSYLASQKDGKAPVEIADRAKGLLDRGYKKLTSYEAKSQGYEWFGADPGHEALTAYGLMQFSDMAKVFPVEGAMLERTKTWLLAKRDGKGGYRKNERALDSFGRASDEVTNAYVTYALTEVGTKDLANEIAYVKTLAKSTKDPYVLSLATGALVNAEPGADTTRSAVARLIGMQDKDGHFEGAAHSITRSGGKALLVETTALAAMTLTKAGGDGTAAAGKALSWLASQRNGAGGFGSTQATVLALKALTRGAEIAGGSEEGTAIVRINGGPERELAVKPDGKGTLVLSGLESALSPGKNTIVISGKPGVKAPFSFSVRYRTKKPVSSAKSPLAFTVTAPKSARAGESVTAQATITNTTNAGLPMVIARIGLPGGLTYQTWQLDELRDKKLIDFYETREREVILYFRAMAPKAKKTIDIRLLAAVPGAFTAPPSQTYLYYTDEHRTFDAPLAMTVTR